jgi:hypothetical protein
MAKKTTEGIARDPNGKVTYTAPDGTRKHPKSARRRDRGEALAAGAAAQARLRDVRRTGARDGRLAPRGRFDTQSKLGKIRGSTAYSYRRFASEYVNPAMGARRAQDLRPGELSKLYAELLDNGRGGTQRSVGRLEPRDREAHARHPERGVPPCHETRGVRDESVRSRRRAHRAGAGDADVVACAKLRDNRARFNETVCA